MILKEDDFLYKCKLMDITAVHTWKIYNNSNVVLDHDLDDFLSLCQACKTSIIFYDYTYYSSNCLHIDANIVAEELRKADYNKSYTDEMKATLKLCFKKWNEIIETVDYSQPCALRLVTCIGGVITETVYHDNWLDIQYNGIKILVYEGLNAADIASQIARQIIKR